MIKRVLITILLLSSWGSYLNAQSEEDIINAASGKQKWVLLQKYILEKKRFGTPPSSILIFENSNQYYYEHGNNKKYKWFCNINTQQIEFKGHNLLRIYRSFYIRTYLSENVLVRELVLYEGDKYVESDQLYLDDKYYVLVVAKYN